MRNLKIILGVVTVALIVLLTAMPSKREKDSLAYNPKNETTIAGTVQEVQEFYCPVTDDRGTHLLLKTEQGTMMVHVALSRFLREHNLSFNPGERWQVTGAKIRYEGKEGLIARELARGAEVYTLRDASGKPLWVKD